MNFSLQLAGGAMGAFGGAWAAQIAILRYRRATATIAEIRACNAVIAMTVVALNNVASFAKQVMLPQRADYEARKNAFMEYLATPAPLRRPLNSTYNLSAPMPILTPINEIKTECANKITLSPGGYMALHSLSTSLAMLDDAISIRRDALENFKRETMGLDDLQKSIVFFGAPDEQGGIDARISDTIEYINHSTTDSLFFLREFATACAVRADKIYSESPWWVRKSLPKPKPIDWSMSVVPALIPDNQRYRDWSSNYGKYH